MTKINFNGLLFSWDFYIWGTQACYRIIQQKVKHNHFRRALFSFADQNITLILKVLYNVFELTVSIWLERLWCSCPVGACPVKCCLDPHKIIPVKLIGLPIKSQFTCQYGCVSALCSAIPLSSRPTKKMSTTIFINLFDKSQSIFILFYCIYFIFCECLYIHFLCSY